MRNWEIGVKPSGVSGLPILFSGVNEVGGGIVGGECRFYLWDYRRRDDREPRFAERRAVAGSDPANFREPDFWLTSAGADLWVGRVTSKWIVSSRVIRHKPSHCNRFVGLTPRSPAR